MDENNLVKILPETRDVFWYELYHVYAGAKGVIRVGISFLFLVFGVYSVGKVEWILTVLMMVLGVMNILITPFVLYKKALKLHGEQKPAYYTFSPHEVSVVQGEQSGTVRWQDFYNVTLTKRCIILYTDLTHALLIPCRQLNEEQKREIRKYVSHK